jgi:hypothetical protein
MLDSKSETYLFMIAAREQGQNRRLNQKMSFPCVQRIVELLGQNVLSPA